MASPTRAADHMPADLIVVRADVWTADPALPHASAFAVRDGVFIAVGEEDDIRAVAGPGARVVDAGGRRVVPGLIDTHVHLVSAAIDRVQVEIRDAASRDDLLRRVADRAQRLAPDDWLVGRGWSAESWPDSRPPSPEELDEASGGRKTVLVRMDGHSLIASRSALEAAGVTSGGPPDPPGGRIGRRASGEPDGAVYEEAMDIVTALLPRQDAAGLQRLVRDAVAEANAFGLTQLGVIESRESLETVLAPLARSGGLSIRLAATITSPVDTIDEWRPIVEWAAAHRDLAPSVRILGVKGFMDGSLGSRTAWQTAPYLDNPPDRGADNAGMPLAMAGSGEMRDLILLTASMGLQPTVHAIGDRANHVLLGWYAELSDDQRRALRPRIEHAQHLLPDDVGRFALLGVIPSMQPLHKADDGRYAESRLGRERLKSSYAYRALLDSGAALAFGSDWPVVSENPFLGMHAAVSGRAMDGRPFVPEQSIRVEEALRAYTAGAAFCLHDERRTGAIRVGLAADFVVLDRDILTIPTDRIPTVRASMTVVGGRIVHEAR